jgi:quinoprotein relay system zinc metallohydrolase 2
MVQASADSKDVFNLTEVAPGVYVHQGRHVSFESPGHDDIANIGFIVGDNCVAVIDTGGSLRVAHALLSELQKTTPLPICFVINTHIHFDHLLGNIVFQNKGVKFVGHKNLADEVDANRAFFLEQFRGDLGNEPTENSIIGPNLLVDDSMQLDLGNRILDLTAYDSAHSHTDLSIFDRRTSSLWLSDLLFMQRIPALDGNLIGWLTISKKIRETSAERVIPGHGPASANPSSALDAQQRYLEILLSQTRKKIADGLFMEDIVDTVGSQEKQLWLLYEQHHKRNVTKAFSQLEWE